VPGLTVVPPLKVIPPHPPFAAGNSVSVTHGGRSAERVLARRLAVEAALMADPATPEYLKRDGSHRGALVALCRAEAIVSLLEEWLDGLDVRDALSEVVEEDETEERPAMGAVKRRMQGRRVASVLDQIHKHDTRAMHLRVRLGLDPLSRARLGADLAQTVDAAAVWAQMWEAKQAGRRAEGSV
jgi:hypothetical protein